LLLKAGRIVDQGSSDTVVRSYLCSGASESTRCECRVEERPELAFQILSIAVTTPKGELAPKIGLWDSIQIRVDYVVRRRLSGTNAAVWLSRDGNTVFMSFDTDLSPEAFAERAPGYYRTIIPVPTGLLPVGAYSVSAATGMPSLVVIDAQRDAVSFEVAADGEDITNKSYSRQAMVIAKLPWRTEIFKFHST
jgi:lipopolysaccharide transport system ATP-binding protein